MTNSVLVCKNITFEGRRTSIRADVETLDAMADVSTRLEVSVDEVIDRARKAQPEGSLTNAIRSYLLTFYREALVSLEG